MDNNKYANAKEAKIIYRFFFIYYCCVLADINVVPKEYLMYTVCLNTLQAYDTLRVGTHL
jgi:hypothetical protein